MLLSGGTGWVNKGYQWPGECGLQSLQRSKQWKPNSWESGNRGEEQRAQCKLETPLYRRGNWGTERFKWLIKCHTSSSDEPLGDVSHPTAKYRLTPSHGNEFTRPITAYVKWMVFQLGGLKKYTVAYFFFSLPWNNTVVMILWLSAWNGLKPSSINIHRPIPEIFGFPKICSSRLRPCGIWGAFEGMAWPPAVPISIPRCFSYSINLLIPVRVSFNGRTESLARDVRDLPSSGGLNSPH